MTVDELKVLEAQIAEKRAAREAANRDRLAARDKARALSDDIRTLERQLPPKKTRNQIKNTQPPGGTEIRMTVRPATVGFVPKKK